MKRENLYYVQLAEALRFAESDVFAYKRIALILFDNMIEGLLKTKVFQGLRHKAIMGEIERQKFEKNTKHISKYFEDLLKQARETGLINEAERKIILLCHSERNNLFHQFAGDPRIVNFGIGFYLNFFAKDFDNLLKTGITDISDKHIRERESFLRTGGFADVEGLQNKLNTLSWKIKKNASCFLADILFDYIETIEFFLEENENIDWKNFEKEVEILFFEENNKVESFFLIQFFEESARFPQINWGNLNFNKLNNLKKKAERIRTLPIDESFGEFSKANQYLRPIYYCIGLYNSKEEYLASLDD